MQVVFLALVVYQTCHTSGVACSGSVTSVSSKWCFSLWQCNKCVTQVKLLALVVLQMCHAIGVAGFGNVTNMSRKWKLPHIWIQSQT
jgi:hypothetical protein